MTGIFCCRKFEERYLILRPGVTSKLCHYYVRIEYSMNIQKALGQQSQKYPIGNRNSNFQTADVSHD